MRNSDFWVPLRPITRHLHLACVHTQSSHALSMAVLIASVATACPTQSTVTFP